MRTQWESPADDPDPPECDDEFCQGGDDCVEDNCQCECHKECEGPDGYQSEADLQALTDHYHPA